MISTRVAVSPGKVCGGGGGVGGGGCGGATLALDMKTIELCKQIRITLEGVPEFRPWPEH